LERSGRGVARENLGEEDEMEVDDDAEGRFFFGELGAARLGRGIERIEALM